MISIATENKPEGFTFVFATEDGKTSYAQVSKDLLVTPGLTGRTLLEAVGQTLRDALKNVQTDPLEKFRGSTAYLTDALNASCSEDFMVDVVFHEDKKFPQESYWEIHVESYINDMEEQTTVHVSDLFEASETQVLRTFCNAMWDLIEETWGGV